MGVYFDHYFDKISDSPDFHDYRCIADDKTILRNPHKGWYWHYIDNGYGRDNYRVLHDPADHCEDFPGLNHLYLRFDWGDIEREEGVYDWSYIDAIMDEWSQYDYRFAFRICTYEADPTGSLAYATPKWVFDAGAKYTVCHGGAYEPDYGDPIFLEKLGNFMKEYGRKFNNDPRVELIDIGTFGTWGEGHAYFGSEGIWPLEVMKKHIDLHTENFPDKFCLFNDDMVNGRSAHVPKSDSLAMIEHAVKTGCGARDDSVCVAGYCKTCGYNTLRTPFLFDHFWKQAPIDLEFEHYHGVLHTPENWRDGFPFLDALMRTHSTFAGFHGYPRPWLEKQKYFTEYVANRVGYWYFLDGIDFPVLNGKGENTLKLHFHNQGFAPCYYRYTVKIRLTDTTGANFVYELPQIDNRTWMPGETAIETVELPLDLGRGDYMISIGMFEGDRPIQLAIAPKYLDPDGFYRLGKAVVETR